MGRREGHVHFIALSFVVQVPAEEGEKVIHLGFEELFAVRYQRFFFHSALAVAVGCFTRFCFSSLTDSASLVSSLRI
jgi:hypothetical protein